MAHSKNNSENSLENVISCCDIPLVFNKEEKPEDAAEAYYFPESAECGKCRLKYERSPTGHLYIQDGRSYDDMFCAEDGGILERRLHLFKAKGFPGGIGWEFVIYCPRHEKAPEEFLDNIYPKEEFMNMFGMPDFYQVEKKVNEGLSALFAISMKKKKP